MSLNNYGVTEFAILPLLCYEYFYYRINFLFCETILSSENSELVFIISLTQHKFSLEAHPHE